MCCINPSSGYNDVPWTNPDIHAPNLDILSRKSLILENHYAMSVCVPSRAALMTGYYPTTTGTYFMVISTLSHHFSKLYLYRYLILNRVPGLL